MADPIFEKSGGVGTSTRAEAASAARGEGVKVRRVFTKAGAHPFDSIVWEKRVSKISNPDGSTVFEMKDVEVPATWSQLATDIVVSKYFRKAGVPGTGHETSARQPVTRVARSLRKAGEQFGGYFASKEDADTF